MSKCIEWWGYIGNDGYGRRNRATDGGRPLLAHRVIWAECFGAIPDGLVLHHECHNRRCVNPEHLRLMTLSDHCKLHKPRPTHCLQGHLYDEANTYVRASGIRRCRKCHAANELARKRGYLKNAEQAQP